jgi:hypothetical protein
VLVGAHRLLEAARRPIECQQTVELRPREARRRGELRPSRLSAVGLHVVAAGRPHLGETADGMVGESDRPRHLRNQLLHGLADPERRVAPERRLHARVIAPGCEQQPDHTLLHQLRALHPPAAANATGDAPDRREEQLNKLPACRLVAALRCNDQRPLLLR